jgi:hypothetical protein
MTLTHTSLWHQLNKHYRDPYRGDEEDAEEVAGDRAKISRSSIIGPTTEAFPLNEGWHMASQSPTKEDGKPRRLSDLTIHEITVALTEATTNDQRPNCEMNWPKALAKHGISLDINWQELWSSIGTPLTDPTEENAWWRLIQRAWNAKNRHPTEPDKSCRLNCGCNDESMLHMITCSRAKPLWKACLKICTTLFNERDGLNIVSAIVFNQDNGKMLSPLTRAFLRHAVQQYYQDVTNVAKHKRAFF